MSKEPEQLDPDLPEAWVEFIDPRECAAAERASAYNDHYRRKAELDDKFGEPHTAPCRRWSLRTMLATLALLACWIWYGVWLGRDGVGVGVIAFSAASFFIAVFSLGALLTLLTTGKDGE